MTNEIEPLTASQAIVAVPMEVRPAVCDWLEAMAVNADTTCSRLIEANRKKKDPTIIATISYWQNVASGHRLAAARMRMSGAVPKPRGRKGTDERSE